MTGNVGRTCQLDLYVTRQEKNRIEAAILLSEASSKSEVVREAICEVVPELVAGGDSPIHDTAGSGLSYPGDKDYSVQTYVTESVSDMVQSAAEESDMQSVSALLRWAVDGHLRKKYGKRLENVVEATEAGS